MLTEALLSACDGSNNEESILLDRHASAGSDYFHLFLCHSGVHGSGHAVCFIVVRRKVRVLW